MKVAVVGCGNISRNHFKALSAIEGVEIVAAVDIKKERADEKAAKYGAKAYYDFDEMLKAEKPDCVHIATPHYLHTQMALKALAAGANVFTEKPCSVSCEEVEVLRKAQTESGKQVGVCFQNRYNESSLLIKEAIDSEKFGKILGIRAFLTWDRGTDYYSDDWHGTLDKECGGVLINQAIHTVDLVQFFGGGCKALTAHISNDHLKGAIEVEDTATVLMELNCGAKAVIYATTAYSENSDVLIEVKFENGTLRLEGEKLYEIGNDGSIKILCVNSDKPAVGKSYWGHGHSAIISDFCYCVENGKKFTIDAFEGGKAANIISACYLSAEKNIKTEPEG